MIYDSNIWKEELKALYKNFKERIEQTDFSLDWYLGDDNDEDWDDNYRFFIDLQKFCFYSAVIIRKFIESNRLSDELKSKSFKVVYHNRFASQKPLTKDSFTSTSEEYDTENKNVCILTLEKISNLFIHSFIFQPQLEESKIDPDLPDEDIENWEIGTLQGVFVNSDFSKDKTIIYLPIKQIFAIFEEVANDRVMSYSWDADSGKEKRSKKVSKRNC